MRFVCCLLFVLCGLIQPSVVFAAAPKSDLIEVDPFPSGGDFTLHSKFGKTSLHDFKGYTVLLFFGYTSCPDICPTTLGTLQQTFKKLTPGERSKVKVIFITVDPERDTPERLNDYLSFFELPATGMTGTPEQIAAVADQYGAQYARVDLPGSAMVYGMDHSSAVYLLHADGRLSLIIRHTASPNFIAEHIRRRLAK